jgi:hypothetical protein
METLGSLYLVSELLHRIHHSYGMAEFWNVYLISETLHLSLQRCSAIWLKAVHDAYLLL